MSSEPFQRLARKHPIGSPNSSGTEIDICEHHSVVGGGVDRDCNTGGNASMCRTEAVATTHSRHPEPQTHPPPLESDVPIDVNHRSRQGFI
jgi:hypothetical protein